MIDNMEIINSSFIRPLLIEEAISVDILDSNYNILFQNETSKKWHGNHTNQKCYKAYFNIGNKCEKCLINTVSEKKILNNFINVRGELLKGYYYKDKPTNTIVKITTEHSNVRKESYILDNEKFKSIINKMDVALFVMDADNGNYIDINEKGEELLGYHRKEVIGQRFTDFLPKDQHQHANRIFNRLKNGEIIPPYQRKIKTKGGPRLVEIAPNGLEINGKISMVISIGKDITDEVKNRKILQHQQHTIDTTLRQMHNFIHMFQSPLTGIYNNLQTAIEILENKNRNLGKSEIEIDVFSYYQHNIKDYIGEIINILQDQKYINYSDHTNRLNNHYKRINDIQIETDLTQKVFNEGKINENIIRIYLELSRLIKKLKTKEDTKHLEKISMEVLLSMTNYLDYHLFNLLKGTKHYSYHSNNVYETIRSCLIENSKQKYDFEDIDIMILINRAITNLNPLAREKDLNFELEIPSFIPNVMLADAHVERMFVNILNNAVKYSYSGSKRRKGTINIRVFPKNKFLNISIQSYGIPVKDNEKTLVTKYGYRGEFSKERNRTGQGIGLYDARNVIEKHGGYLKRIESNPAVPIDYLTDPKEKYSKPFLTTVTVAFPIEEGKLK